LQEFLILFQLKESVGQETLRGCVVKAKLYKWNKAKKARKIKSFGIEKRTVQVAKDYCLCPDECH